MTTTARQDEYAAQLTGDPTYTYRHAGPVTRRAINLLIARDWDREQLALAIQQWSDERYCVPLTTRPPEHSSYSLADHLMRAQNGEKA